MLDCIFTLRISSNFSPMHFFCFSSYFLNLIVIFLPSIFIIFHQSSNSLCVVYCPLFILPLLHLLISITFKHPKSLLASVQKYLVTDFQKNISPFLQTPYMNRLSAGHKVFRIAYSLICWYLAHHVLTTYRIIQYVNHHKEKLRIKMYSRSQK